MSLLKHDITNLEDKLQIQSILNVTPAFEHVEDSKKAYLSQLFYDWIHKVQPYDLIVGFLGVGYMAIGQVLGPCAANMDVAESLFKYARATQWSEQRIPVGPLTPAERGQLFEARESLMLLDDLTATRVLLLALMQAPHWDDLVLLSVAQCFSDEFLQNLNPERYAEYQELLAELSKEEDEDL